MIAEDGSDLAAELWNADQPVASSVLSYAEGRAALAAARRGGRLTKRGHASALGDFEQIQVEMISVGVDADLARDAGARAEVLGLRGYDAVHLATALALGDEEVILVTWDVDLAGAAERVGLGIAGPS